MKLFIDSANLDEIKAAAQTGLIDGVTTNPSLIAKEKTDFKATLKEICESVQGPVSAEVTALETDEMLRQAEVLAAISKHIVIKVPLTPQGLKACRHLVDKKIPVNVTLCFSANQALLAAKAGATYISPFIGRLDDQGQIGMNLIEEIVEIYQNYGFSTQILAASIRHPEHVLRAALAGADVSTIPAKIFHSMFQHPLTDLGLEKFLKDWKSTNFKIEA
jgi:transaldolase